MPFRFPYRPYRPRPYASRDYDPIQPRRAKPPPPRWPVPPLERAWLPGVDTLVQEVVDRCNPLRQPNVLLVGPELMPANLAELARRCFHVLYVPDNGSVCDAHVIEACRLLAEPHQHDRMFAQVGSYHALPAKTGTMDAVVCVMAKPFADRFELLLTLCELKRVMNTCRRLGVDPPFLALRGRLPNSPSTAAGVANQLDRTPLSFTAAGDHLMNVQTLIYDAGLCKAEPTLEAMGINLPATPPTFTWRLTLAKSDRP